MFTSSVADLGHDYIRPQENGSRADCELVELTGPGLALTVVGARRFSFNASAWTQEELTRARHDVELEPCGSTVLCLDAAMSGIGSNSCGPALLERYRVDDAELKLNLRLVPSPTDHPPTTRSLEKGELMPEKKYLRWYNKVGYGSGDVAGNVVYALLSAFVMIYLTDTVGLNAGVVGTLMMVSKLFDGFSDFVFGTLLDKTQTRMGKARPWMLWAFFGCAAMIIAIFAIPVSLGDTAKYAWFFIAYTLLNAVFYTANNIA